MTLQLHKSSLLHFPYLHIFVDVFLMRVYRYKRSDQNRNSPENIRGSLIFKDTFQHTTATTILRHIMRLKCMHIHCNSVIFSREFHHHHSHAISHRMLSFFPLYRRRFRGLLRVPVEKSGISRVAAVTARVRGTGSAPRGTAPPWECRALALTEQSTAVSRVPPSCPHDAGTPPVFAHLRMVPVAAWEIRALYFARGKVGRGEDLCRGFVRGCHSCHAHGEGAREPQGVQRERGYRHGIVACMATVERVAEGGWGRGEKGTGRHYYEERSCFLLF